jgi:glucose/arabinose dehydrogenase
MNLLKLPTVFLGIIFSLIFMTGAGTPLRAQVNFTNAFPGLTFAAPVYFGVFPGKAKTYVVLEQHEGNIILVSQKGAAWVKDTLLKIAVNQGGEMGLLGVAFHPDFINNRKYYISYDPPQDFFNILEERIVDVTLLKDSRTPGLVLINIKDKYGNHNGGTIAFGPKDGFLYFGTGDGGSGGDPDGNAQNKNVLLGKMLRIDVNKKDAELNYGIPTDNPFATAGGSKEIFAYGLRNPWKWSFDPLNGDLWVGDVGQNQIEEVDIVTLGGNYGWKVMEGPNGTNSGSMALPVYSYGRSAGTCIIGGVVYRGNSASKYYGTFFVSDNGTRTVWNLKKNEIGLATVETIGTAPTAISSFGTDELGRVFVCGHSNGIIYNLVSPDLGPADMEIRGQSPGRSLGRTFAIGHGLKLPMQAFAASESAALFSLKGNHVDDLSRISPELGPHIRPGLYILRTSENTACPNLLRVE